MMVDNSPVIQYTLLLSRLGYSEPKRPRRDLNFADKVEFLKNYQRRLENCDEIHPSRIEYRGKIRFSSDYGWFRGAFSHLSSHRDHGTHGGAHAPDVFHVYVLPSPNRAITEHSTWQLSDLGVPVMDYASRLSADLLVLFEKNLPPDTGITIHLRSLSSGTTHPSASFPSLVFRPSQVYLSLDIKFRIIGDFVMLLVGLDDEYEKSELVIWDWPSGMKVAVSHSCILPDTRLYYVQHMYTHGYSFAFISPNVLVVPQYTNSSQGPTRTLGQLDIFTLTPITSDGDDLANTIQLVASLELPSIASIHDITDLCVSIDSSRSPTIPSRTTPCNSTDLSGTVFDPLPGDDLIIISFILERGDFWSPRAESVLGTILIHHSDMNEVLRPSLSQESPDITVIRWSEWAKRAVWAGLSENDPQGLRFFAARHLVSIIRSRQIVLYEVRPWNNSAGRLVDESSSIESREPKPKPQSSRLPLGIEIENMLTTGTNKLRRPTFLSAFRIPEEIAEPMVAMDEEHSESISTEA